MRQGIRRISQEEMHRRIDELLAIHKGVENPETVAKKWTERKGKPLATAHVKECYRLVEPRIKCGVDLHELAKSHGWSDIIWSLRPGTE